MNNVSLKLADKSDAPIVFDFLQKLATQLGAPENFKGTVEALEKYGFGARPAFEVIVAYAQDSPIGCILYFEEFSTWRCSPGIYVQDLFVNAESRGLGIGKLLIEAVARRGSELQATYLRLSVDVENTPAFEFYRAIGFEHKQKEQILMLNIDGQLQGKPK